MIKDLSASDPTSVGQYRLLGRLGAGGMGQVYLARSPGGRPVAIKLIRPELAEERGFRARFSSEISAAKNVSGIYTAAVVDADADAELPWMATVYVPGPSLADAVEDNGALPVKSVLALAAGLAEALQAIHRAGLVHRDLKPSNVLLATDGPRVIDFGISMALERSMMTATGMVMGSPGFMSPEQARGQREVGPPTDVFSLGAVLAFAATGSNPFGAGPTPALLYRVVNEAPDLAAIPAELSSLIGQCLAKDPADRPTPAELLERLSGEVGVLSGDWLPAPITEAMSRYTPTTQVPVTPPVPARPTFSATVPTTGAGHGPLPDTSHIPAPGAVTAGRDTPGSRGGVPPADRGQTAPPPRRRWIWLAAVAAAAVVVAVVAVLLTAHSPGAAARNGATPTASHGGRTTAAPTSAPASPTVTRQTSAPAQQASTPVTQTSAATSAPTTAQATTAQPTTAQATTAQATTGAPSSSPSSGASLAPTPAGQSAPASAQVPAG